MRSYIARRTNGIGAISLSNIAAGISNTATDIKNRINQFAIDNPNLAQTLKEGGVNALIDLKNKGIISQQMYDKLISGNKPPAKEGMSTMTIVALGAAALGTMYFLSKDK